MPQLDGSRSVRELVDQTGFVEFEVGKAVYGLIQAGFAERVGKREAVPVQRTRDGDVQEARNLALHDALTGLPNRYRFAAWLDRAVGPAAAPTVAPAADHALAGSGGQPCALLCIDLDGFKPVNDRYGHALGDALRAAFLAEVAGLAPSGVSFAAARERRIDLLADLVEEHLDVDALLGLARSGAPADLPSLTMGMTR